MFQLSAVVICTSDWPRSMEKEKESGTERECLNDRPWKAQERAQVVGSIM